MQWTAMEPKALAQRNAARLAPPPPIFGRDGRREGSRRSINRCATRDSGGGLVPPPRRSGGKPRRGATSQGGGGGGRPRAAAQLARLVEGEERVVGADLPLPRGRDRAAGDGVVGEELP